MGGLPAATQIKIIFALPQPWEKHPKTGTSRRPIVSRREVFRCVSKLLIVQNGLEIAQKAVALLQEDTAVFVGSGTTTAQFARVFPNGKYFVTTTGLNCAMEFSALPDISLMMLGGSVNKNSFCVNGTIADKMIGDMHFNIAFLGVGGYLPGKGFTTSVIEDYILRQSIVKNSNMTAILMDSTKYGRSGVSTFTFATPEMIHYVITDDKLPDKAREELMSHGITVL